MRKLLPMLGAIGTVAALLVPGASADAFALFPGQNVTTANGTVQGNVLLDHREFKGIPFAAPPVGANRFAAPQPAASWKGERSARASGPACAQAYPFIGSLVPSSEDCLYLDVYTPPAAKSKDLPVMVWFYGGAYVLGSTDQYDPTPLAARGDVIVVSVAYRVGPFGFLSLPGASANAGLQDQQAGLRWVQRNIGAFGGNPGNVTIFGESAGGNSVCQQLASPTSAGLFTKAIVQSGACGSGTLDAAPTAEGQAVSDEFATSVGCSDPATALACLRALSRTKLLSSPSTRFQSMKVTWRPTVDGTVVRSSTREAFASGDFHRVPVLIGGNHDEGRLFVALFHHLAQGHRLSAAAYEADVREVFGARTDAILAEYSDVTSRDLALSQIWTDALFACPGAAATTALTAHAPVVYGYELDDEKPPLADIDPLMPLRSYHGSELWYLFAKNFGAPLLHKDARQQQVSRTLIDYWTTFARTGDPNGGGRTDWPASTTGQQLRLGAAVPTTSARSAFATDHRCEFWT